MGTNCLKIAEVRHSQRSAVFRKNSLSPKFKMASLMSCEEALEQIMEEEIFVDPRKEEEEETEHSILTKTLNTCLEMVENSEMDVEFFVDTGVAMLVALLAICRRGAGGITQAGRLLSSSQIFASTVFRSESRLWLETIHRRLSGRRRVRNPFFTEITRDIPYEMFWVFLKVVKSIDGFGEPFISFGKNRKAEVVSFTTLRPVKELFSLLSGLKEGEVVKYFKKTLITGKKSGSKVAVLATEEKDMAFLYKLSKGQLVITYHFGEWNKFGFPQHN